MQLEYTSHRRARDGNKTPSTLCIIVFYSTSEAGSLEASGLELILYLRVPVLSSRNRLKKGTIRSGGGGGEYWVAQLMSNVFPVYHAPRRCSTASTTITATATAETSPQAHRRGLAPLLSFGALARFYPTRDIQMSPSKLVRNCHGTACLPLLASSLTPIISHS